MKRFLLLSLFVADVLSASHCMAQNIWEQTQGPQWGDVSSLLMDTSGVIYAPSQLGFISTNDGLSWKRPYGANGLGTAFSTVMDVDGTIYALAGPNPPFRSTDGGVSWKRLDVAIAEPKTVYALALRPGTYLFVSCEGDVQRYDIRARTWKKIPLVPGGLNRPENKVRSFALDSSGAIYAATLAGIYKSEDNGDSWTGVFVGLIPFWSIAAGGGDHVYAAGDSLFMVSDDRGKTWAPYASEVVGPSTIVTRGDRDVFVGVLMGKFLRSTNWGITWRTTTVSGMYPHSVLVTRTNAILVGSTLHGVFRSTDDGATWTRTSKGMNYSAIGSVAVAPSRRIYAAVLGGSYGGAFFNSTDRGETWSGLRPAVVPNQPWCLAAISNDNVLGGTRGTGLYRTTDEGLTWVHQNTGIAGKSVWSLYQHPEGDIFACTDSGLFRSTDLGASWNATALMHTSIYSFARYPDGTLFAGADSAVHYSMDKGITWTKVLALGSATEMTALKVFPDGSVYAVSYNSGGYRSTDVGRSWKAESLPSGLHVTFRWYTITTGPSGEVYLVGSPEGIFRSTDNGHTWTRFSTGLPAANFSATEIAVDSAGYLWMGSQYWGVVRSVASVVMSVEQELSADRSSSFALSVAPNPTTGRATFSFTLSEPAIVELRIHDRLGADVATLVAGRLPSGRHDLSWNADEQPAGIYIYALRIDDRTVNGRLLIRR